MRRRVYYQDKNYDNTINAVDSRIILPKIIISPLLLSGFIGVSFCILIVSSNDLFGVFSNVWTGVASMRG